MSDPVPVLVLSEKAEDCYEGSYGNLEVLVLRRKDRWSYTLIERRPNGGYGRTGSAPQLKEVLKKISQHLFDIRVWILLEN